MTGEERLAELRAAVRDAWRDAARDFAPHGGGEEDVIRPVVEAELELRQAEHEDDLERARATSYQLGALVVIDTFRARLQATEGVPSRTALLAFMRTMERSEGGRP